MNRTTYLFTPASAADFDQTMALYRRCAAAMNAMGLYNWNEDYPGDALVRRDIEAGDLQLLRLPGGAIAGAVAANALFDERYYDRVPWRSPAPAATLHRLCTDPALQRGGVASELVMRCEELLRGRGYASMRLDCYAANERAFALYRKLGYELIVRMPMYRGEEYLFLEKPLR